VSNTHVRHATARERNVTSVGVQSPLLGLLSYLNFHSEIQDCPCIGAADVSGASRQPTSCQNRRPENLPTAPKAQENCGWRQSRRGNAGICTHMGAST